LVRKSRAKKSPENPGLKWELRIKIVLGEILYERVYWIDLAQDTDNWRCILRTVMKLRVS
jgi:hypothetical protein